MGSATALSLIIQCACLSKNIHEAETYFFLRLLLRSTCSRTVLGGKLIAIDSCKKANIDMMKRLLDGRDSCTLYPLFFDDATTADSLAANEDMTKKLALITEHFELKALAAEPVDGILWDVMVKLYSGRKSWIHCKAVLDYLGIVAFPIFFP